jgi:hypothetical protein
LLDGSFSSPRPSPGALLPAGMKRPGTRKAATLLRRIAEIDGRIARLERQRECVREALLHLRSGAASAGGSRRKGGGASPPSRG